MELMEIALIVSCLLCSLVAGLVFTFAIIVMPGIRSQDDLAFLKSFKVMDGVIQNNQPIFIAVWLGSALSLIVYAVMGFWYLEGLDRALLSVACVIFILGVHLPTVAINIPLNNELQAKDLNAASSLEVQELKEKFDSQWTRWNSRRTVISLVTTILLLVLLQRI